MSKAIQKPGRMAAVENAVRVIGNAAEAPLQASYEESRAPEDTLLAGCVVDGPILIHAKATEEQPLLAGCVIDNVAGIRSEK